MFPSNKGSHLTTGHFGLLTTSRFCDIWPQSHLSARQLTASDIWPRDIWPQVTFDRGTFDRKWHLTARHLTAVTFDHRTFDRKWHLTAGHLTASEIWLRDVWPQVTFDRGIFDRQPKLKSHEFFSNHALIDKLGIFFFLAKLEHEWGNPHLRRSRDQIFLHKQWSREWRKKKSNGNCTSIPQVIF